MPRTKEFSLDAALNTKNVGAKRGPKPLGDDATRKLRDKERNHRYSSADALAKKALARVHYAEYRAYVLQAKEQIDAERGPLPGD